MRQRGLTVVTEILPGKKQELQELLEAIGGDINDNTTVPFHEFQTVHFMRWVILDEAEVRAHKIPAKLVLSTNYDGPLEHHLSDLCTNAKAGLQTIYSYCSGCPTSADVESMMTYLKSHQKPIAAFYRGTSGRKVIQIRKEQKLWSSIQSFLNNRQNTESSAQEIKNSLFSALKNDSSLSWAFKKYSHEFIYSYRWVMALLLVSVIVVLGLILFDSLPQFLLYALLPLALVFIVWLLLLKQKEKKDRKAFNAIRQDASRISQLTKKEDYKTQNQLTHLVDVKPGLTRAITLRVVLWLINLLAKYLFNQGSLAGIQSIHYARWVLLDGGRRLLFFSNYDGSWESYLGEFVDRASVGLTAVWSNTEGFPPTRNLIKEGARHSAEFKAWARKQQIPTQVWYSAYPESSIKNINNNTEIRIGLLRNQNEKESREFLLRL